LTLILVHQKWLPSSLYLFALGVLMLPYLTFTGGPFGFRSMTRFILLAFPVFIVMAKLCKNRLWLIPCITGTFWRHAIRLFGLVCSVVLGSINGERYGRPIVLSFAIGPNPDFVRLIARHHVEYAMSDTGGR
jgi:hypothetical protein